MGGTWSSDLSYVTLIAVIDETRRVARPDGKPSDGNAPSRAVGSTSAKLWRTAECRLQCSVLLYLHEPLDPTFMSHKYVEKFRSSLHRHAVASGPGGFGLDAQRWNALDLVRWALNCDRTRSAHK